MRAATATELAATISSFTGGGTGSLKATATGNTVLVTGTLTGVTTDLDLNIDTGVTVLWQAVISANTTYPIFAEGDGTFNVVAGGSISSIGGNAIILYHCNLIVSGGEINASGNAIIFQDVPKITVSSGTVSAGDRAIVSAGTGSLDCFYDNNSVTISGTGKVQSTNEAIDIAGSVEVKDNAQVISTTNIAIDAFGNYGTVTVSGSGRIQGTISTIRDVNITDNAQVISTNYMTIVPYSWIWGTDLSGIIDPFGSNSTITISGSSKVESLENMAIWVNDSAYYDKNTIVPINTKVVVKDNAQVLSMAKNLCAISALNLVVSGGLIFAYGDSITGKDFSDYCVINSKNYTGVTGTGTVIAWNQAAGNTIYSQGSSNDILQSPTSAKVQWNKNGESSGISYANGTNAGFIPLDVTVNSISVIPNETNPVGTDGKGNIVLNLSIPSDVTLTGTFEIQFPEGMTLDEELTVLSAGLSNSSFLSFTYEENNKWLVEIKANTLKSSTETEYTKIMDIAYMVNDSIGKGSYEAIITNLDFLLDDGTSIKEDSLSATITVERWGTAIKNIGKTSFSAYFNDNSLRIESSHAEIITIYSATGVQLYFTKKNAGTIEIPFTSIPYSVYIVKGSKSGTIKVMK